jgi:hypothetical protein
MNHPDTPNRKHVEQINRAIGSSCDEALLAVLRGDAVLAVVLEEGIQTGAGDLDGV